MFGRVSQDPFWPVSGRNNVATCSLAIILTPVSAGPNSPRGTIIAPVGCSSTRASLACQRLAPPQRATFVRIEGKKVPFRPHATSRNTETSSTKYATNVTKSMTTKHFLRRPTRRREGRSNAHESNDRKLFSNITKLVASCKGASNQRIHTTTQEESRAHAKVIFPRLTEYASA